MRNIFNESGRTGEPYAGIHRRISWKNPLKRQETFQNSKIMSIRMAEIFFRKIPEASPTEFQIEFMNFP